MTRLLLCSASPRRRDLLARLGISFEIAASNIDESRLAHEPIRALPLRLSQAKARAGLELHRRAHDAYTSPVIALAADTVVSIGDVELGKPRDRTHARELLSALSGREHVVTTAVSVLARSGSGESQRQLERSCSLDTKVVFRKLSPAQLEWLSNSGDGDDKAGGYALQGLAAPFIERIEGSVTNVIGLPMGETLELLESVGFVLPWNSEQPR